jgi:hypothetical protein
MQIFGVVVAQRARHWQEQLHRHMLEQHLYDAQQLLRATFVHILLGQLEVQMGQVRHGYL